MTQPFPSPIDSAPWDGIPDSDRDFFCFDDGYLPMPETHRQQICRLTKSSAELLGHWLNGSLPAGWSADHLAFPHTDLFQLEDSHWNTETGRQTVRQWLHDRNVPYARTVYLFYDRNRVISLPWKLLLKYWDAFAWSVGYAMIVADHTAQWACSFHHENVILFGTYDEITIKGD